MDRVDAASSEAEVEKTAGRMPHGTHPQGAETTPQALRQGLPIAEGRVSHWVKMVRGAKADTAASGAVRMEEKKEEDKETTTAPTRWWTTATPPRAAASPKQ